MKFYYKQLLYFDSFKIQKKIEEIFKKFLQSVLDY